MWLVTVTLHDRSWPCHGKFLPSFAVHVACVVRFCFWNRILATWNADHKASWRVFVFGTAFGSQACQKKYSSPQTVQPDKTVFGLFSQPENSLTTKTAKTQNRLCAWLWVTQLESKLQIKIDAKLSATTITECIMQHATLSHKDVCNSLNLMPLVQKCVSLDATHTDATTLCK